MAESASLVRSTLLPLEGAVSTGAAEWPRLAACAGLIGKPTGLSGAPHCHLARTPSAGNGQPTRLMLVTEPEARKKLAALCGDQSFIAEAPVVVVACGKNLHLNSATEGPNLWVLVDGAIALDHLTLAARAEGLGTCWIGVIGSKEVKQFVGLSEDMDVVSVTPLGYPASPDAFRAPGPHVPMEEFARWERWA